MFGELSTCQKINGLLYSISSKIAARVPIGPNIQVNSISSGIMENI